LFEINGKTLKILEDRKEDPAEWAKEETLETLQVPDNDREILRRLALIRQHALKGDYRHYLLGLFYDLLDVSGYLRRILKDYAIKQDECSEVVLLNLAIFSNLISQFQRRVRSGNLYKLNEFLYYIQDNVINAASVETRGEAVKIMTVHQAKGLEFPVVVIGSAMEQRFPSSFRKPKYPVPAELKISKNLDEKEEHIRDERRLFYVGMTRAENILLISSADKINVRGGGPSRFIKEIIQGNIVQSVKEISNRSYRDEEKIKAPKMKRLSYSGLHAYLLCPFR
jgi:DNA helicase II / ATP-dependent DNA helicase PcrA